MLLVECLCESFGDDILQHYISRCHISAFVSCFNNSDCLYGSATVFKRSPSPACACGAMCQSYPIKHTKRQQRKRTRKEIRRKSSLELKLKKKNFQHSKSYSQKTFFTKKLLFANHIPHLARKIMENHVR